MFEPQAPALVLLLLCGGLACLVDLARLQRKCAPWLVAHGALKEGAIAYNKSLCCDLDCEWKWILRNVLLALQLVVRVTLAATERTEGFLEG